MDDAAGADIRPGLTRRAAKEQHMLDPKEQAKGGFRAHAEREQARRDALAPARRPADAATGLTADDATDAPTTARGQADGARAPEPLDADGERSPYAPEDRPPKRRR